MDSPKSLMIPFWEEENTMVVDLSTSEIYDILSRFSVTVFMTNRAWWNSNIVMENFTPQFMPFIETDGGDINDLLKLYAERFVQRNTTHDVPLRKGVEVTHGLSVYRNEALEGSFLKNPIFKEDGNKGIPKWEFVPVHPDIGNEHDRVEFITTDFFVRLPGYQYFNGERYV